MPSPAGRTYRPRLEPALVLFSLLGAMLWLAGGASRAELFAQVLVRATAWATLIAAILFLPAPQLRPARAVAFLLAGAIAIASLQLLPLPPAAWQLLPGRSILMEAAVASGQPQPWRPWSMVPGATVNALSSLVVPLVVVVLVTAMRSEGQRRLMGLLLGFAASAMFVGLMQFAGADLRNPLVNDTAGQVSATFANRNHFALLMAIGCAAAPAWALGDGGEARWRLVLAVTLMPLFLLAIIASGSRAGVMLGGVGLVAGVMAVAKPARHLLRRGPRWVFPAVLSAGVAVAGTLMVVSVLAGRAVAIDRILTSDVGQDMRSRGLPTVLGMIREYFPFGVGLGGFDALFRMHEPFDLLKPTYFNHAHNDWLETALGAGIPGIMLMGGAVAWWSIASIRAWRGATTTSKLGSIVVVLVMLASIFDYPARTPAIMAVVTLGALWLSGVGATPALPRGGRHL